MTTVEMGAAIRRIRLARGITSRSLARRAGVGHCQLSQFELRGRRMSLRHLLYVVEALGLRLELAAPAVSATHVLSGEDAPSASDHQAGAR